MLHHVVMIQRGQSQVFEIVAAAAATGRFARRLNGGQQQCYQDPDDRDHHEQFDERKARSSQAKLANRSLCVNSLHGDIRFALRRCGASRLSFARNVTPTSQPLFLIFILGEAPRADGGDGARLTAPFGPAI
jgi:hypothetical protein